jgi:hypothetical protein
MDGLRAARLRACAAGRWPGVGVLLDARDTAGRIQGDEQVRGYLDPRSVRQLPAQDVPLDVAAWQRVAADLLVAEVVQVARQPPECPQVVVNALLCLITASSTGHLLKIEDWPRLGLRLNYAH